MPGKATNPAAITPTPQAALTVGNPVDDQLAINAALAEMGLIQIGEGGSIARVKISGNSFEFPDGEIFPSNQKTKAPAFYGRLLDVPLEYQALYFEEEDAQMVNRPEIAKRFCKSHYYIANQMGNVAEDGTNCRTCPVNPFTDPKNNPLGKKCKWRADVVFQHCDEFGNSEDNTEYVLSLPTTSVMELKGTKKDKTKGYVSEFNFMQKLSRFGIANIPNAASITAAVTQIGTALRSGQIIAAFRIAQASNSTGNQNFEVVVLDPVNMVMVDAPAAALPAGETEERDTTKGTYDDPDEVVKPF